MGNCDVFTVQGGRLLGVGFEDQGPLVQSHGDWLGSELAMRRTDGGQGWDEMLSSPGVNRSYHMQSPRTARGP